MADTNMSEAKSAGASESANAPSTSTKEPAQRSPKRKASEANAAGGESNSNGNGNGNNTNTNEKSEGKKKRRKVNHACVYCRRSHMTCDLERPCARCVKRDIGHLCHDEPREPPKRTKSEISVADIAPAPGEGIPAAANGHMHQHNGVSHINGTAHLAQPTPVSPSTLQRPIPHRNSSTGALQNVDWTNNGGQSQFQDMHHLHPNYMFNTSEVTNEYNLLNDFLSSSIMEDGAMYNDSDAQVLFNDPLLATSSMTAHLTNPNLSTQRPPTSNTTQQQRPQMQPPSHPNLAAGQEISRPSSTYPIDSRARDKFYMTAADPAGLSSAEDRLHKLLKAKYDAGMLKPFNYVRGYARLNQYMSKNLTRESQLRILKQLDRFRPKFREAMQSLTDMQLVLVEMWFERSLMEYDRVFASMAIPACCWRRTGEIFRGNAEMAELVRVPVSNLRDGKMALHEIVKEDSLVSYWEKFGAIAFDQSQKAILTSCTLMRPARRRDDSDDERNGRDKEKSKEVKMESVRCCFSFTIRRDTHNIPSLIVGNFLPITERRQPNGQQ
ncbi:Putative zn(2)-C6 fungal-type DNA-binding domain-containing protein [Septoria linicola]|uniref:Zn(2)-C6 fungal-type DNA-binding domain-containing protein n=1 Tax=Septoria linicola TaxID=215465 RepID=A0A9Q9ARH8_9PEZI|nr:putative zn(2)-C6 fungal-type DNA-binding domain-containing protein [Septoria linicola]USW50848.1 Putative zn(2)-C6 fungal-type DNA-binding domain-containing protein [Septoria linicola]